jgi:hypothetical protein
LRFDYQTNPGGAEYLGAATPVQGRWSQKDSRLLMVRE